MTRGWYLGQSLFLAGSAILLLWVFSHTDLDLRLARPFYDSALATFPLRQHWFFAPVFYYGFKFAILAGAMLAGATCLYGLGGHLTWLPRRNAALVLLGLILIPTAVATLRLNINRHCPWDTAEFGGFAPYLDLFAQMPGDIVQGFCFPASHAASGFMWLACGLALHDHSPRLARRIILGAVVLGLVMGLSRQAQGGHFISHTLWSAWLAWAISLALAATLGIGRSGVTDRPQHASPDHGGVYQAE